MKSKLSAVLVLSLVLSVIGCGGTEPPEPTEECETPTCVNAGELQTGVEHAMQEQPSSAEKQHHETALSFTLNLRNEALFDRVCSIQWSYRQWDGTLVLGTILDNHYMTPGEQAGGVAPIPIATPVSVWAGCSHPSFSPTKPSSYNTFSLPAALASKTYLFRYAEPTEVANVWMEPQSY